MWTLNPPGLTEKRYCRGRKFYSSASSREQRVILCPRPLFIRPSLAWRGGTESPLLGGTSFLPPPAQVAGTWHSEAVAASDISLLDAEGTPAPPRVYACAPESVHGRAEAHPKGLETLEIPGDLGDPGDPWRSSCRNNGYPPTVDQPLPGLWACKGRAPGWTQFHCGQDQGSRELTAPRALGALPRASGLTRRPWGRCGEMLM